MDPRRPLLADNLLLIERELRQQGWWDVAPPSAQALASDAPFCVDSLALEQWLQWVLLPRMGALLAAGGALPSASGIQAMAELAFAERLPQAGRLLTALGEFDRLMQARF
ncbi:MAG: YqcC family protein [Pseudomonas sp.]|uniref:YqcC family protein n=1 Tax=Pseudomonas sp. TaxID=306 RepID=UPI0033923BB4